jgi:hypothetical protein
MANEHVPSGIDRRPKVGRNSAISAAESLESNPGQTAGERGAKNGRVSSSPRLLGTAVWSKARSEYVTGNESYAQLAERLGVLKNTVLKHADRRHSDNDGMSWDDARRAYLRRVSSAAEFKSETAATRTLSAVRESSAAVASLALEEIERRLESAGAIETKDLIGIAKLATSLRIELSGDPDGVPVRIERKLDELTVKQLKAIATRCESGSELPTEGGI